jgi:hypothetical protein
VSASPIWPATGSCITPAVGSGGTVTCTWPGATPANTYPGIVLTVRVVPGTHIPPPASNLFVNNSVTASSATIDPNPANNTGAAPPVQVLLTVQGLAAFVATLPAPAKNDATLLSWIATAQTAQTLGLTSTMCTALNGVIARANALAAIGQLTALQQAQLVAYASTIKAQAGCP